MLLNQHLYLSLLLVLTYLKRENIKEKHVSVKKYIKLIHLLNSFEKILPTSYTQYRAKRNRFARITSENFNIFKKPLVEIFEIRNKFSMSKKLRNPPLVETKTKKPAGFFNFVDFGANTQIQCVSEHV